MENIVFLLASNKTKILPAPTLPFPHHGKIRTNTYLSCNVILLLNINGTNPCFINCSGVIPLTNNHFSLFLMQLSALFSVRQYLIFNAANRLKRDQLTSCQEVPPPKKKQTLYLHILIHCELMLQRNVHKFCFLPNANTKLFIFPKKLWTKSI